MATDESQKYQGRQGALSQFLPPLPLFLLDPLLARIVHKAAEKHPELIERLGPHQKARFLIDPINLPFVLYLVPDPDALVFRACGRDAPPPFDARIAARFLDLLRLVDSKNDGDAMFFSRDLDISGNTEAVVSLRNALDNLDGSVAVTAAEALGPPGRLALDLLRWLSKEPQAKASLRP